MRRLCSASIVALAVLFPVVAAVQGRGPAQDAPTPRAVVAHVVAQVEAPATAQAPPVRSMLLASFGVLLATSVLSLIALARAARASRTMLRPPRCTLLPRLRGPPALLFRCSDAR